jgi:hypothetical protein
VLDHEFVGTGNKFATIPETCRGFYSAGINSKSYGTYSPASEVVNFSECTHITVDKVRKIIIVIRK